MLKNGQTYLSFLNYVWPFFNIMSEKVKEHWCLLMWARTPALQYLWPVLDVVSHMAEFERSFFFFFKVQLFILATDIWARNFSFMKSDIVPTLFIQSCFRETNLSLEVPPKNFRSFRANFPLGLKWIQWNNKKLVKSRWKLMLITHPYPFPIFSKCLGLESPCFLGMPKMLWFEALENGAINFENSWLRRTNS